jgi:hypothetical protein
MALRLITADERLQERNLKVTMAIFGMAEVGKMTKTPADGNRQPRASDPSS